MLLEGREYDNGHCAACESEAERMKPLVDALKDAKALIQIWGHGRGWDSREETYESVCAALKAAERTEGK